MVAYTHYRIHIVRYYDGGHVVFAGQVVYQVVNYDGRFWVEAGVWLIHKQIFWLHR